MQELAKKRVKAILIDTAISTVATLALEPLFTKKVKSGFLYTMVMPTAIFWGLEYAQLRTRGQTVGQKVVGIEIRNEVGGEPSPEQIMKRIIHRDTVAPLIYLKNREQYDVFEGEKFPHDVYSQTVVKEV
ncbi:MAG TPA: RDD family protein [Planococcus sp. (in: firmicutes)]|nr:RDD family protein [Planococcus sp. (in: firmicutes)]